MDGLFIVVVKSSADVKTYPFPSSLWCDKPVEKVEVDFFSANAWHVTERGPEEKTWLKLAKRL